MFCEKIIVLNQRNIVIGSFKLLLNNPFLKAFKLWYEVFIHSRFTAWNFEKLHDFAISAFEINSKCVHYLYIIIHTCALI